MSGGGADGEAQLTLRWPYRSGYFLHRKGLFATTFLEQLSELRRTKRLGARTAAGGTIRSSDVEVALQRACVESEARDSAQLANCRVIMLPAYSMRRTGGERKAVAEEKSDGAQASVRFEDIALDGVPFTLRYRAPFPVDLILTPTEIRAYSDLFSYLLALHAVRARVQTSWMSLSKAQRSRRRFTGAGEGGSDRMEERGRRHLLRMACGAAREGLWFLEVLGDHVQTDIIEVQYSKFLHQLQSLRPSDVPPSEAEEDPTASHYGDTPLPPRDTRHGAHLRRVSSLQALDDRRSPRSNNTDTRSLAPPSVGDTMLRRALGARPSRSPMARSAVEGAYLPHMTRAGTSLTAGAPGQETHAGLDFATSRATHQAFLSYVLDGLLLTNSAASACIWRILQTCLRFAALIEQWGGDVLPELLSEGSVAGEDGGPAGGVQTTLQERTKLVAEVTEALRHHIDAFFRLLSDASTSSASGSLTRAPPMSMANGAPSTPRTGKREAVDGMMAARQEAQSAAAHHHEQLLLRLDFNSVLSRRSAKS